MSIVAALIGPCVMALCLPMWRRMFFELEGRLMDPDQRAVRIAELEREVGIEP